MTNGIIFVLGRASRSPFVLHYIGQRSLGAFDAYALSAAPGAR